MALQMNEEEWRRYRAYADQASLRLREVEHPGIAGLPPTAWVVDFNPLTDLDADFLARAVAGIAWRDGSDTFVLSERRETTEWGASGAFWEMLATFGLGMLTNAAYDYLKTELRRMCHGRAAEQVVPIGQGEAVERALVAVTKGEWGETESDLRVVGTETEPGGAGVVAISLVSRSGRSYVVRLEILDGIATIARIEMRESGSSGADLG